MNTDITYCRETAERHDRDRYILTLAAPESCRPALWAVLAFNHEIAKTRDVTRDPSIAHIRLTWWRDAILDGKYTHEVLSALRPVIDEYNLPKSLFVDLINARIRDADNTPPPALPEYASETNLPLMRIFVRILGTDDNDETLNHLATSYGLTGLLRSLSYFIRHDDRVLPSDVLQSIGVAPEQFSHIKPNEKLFTYIRDMARLSRAHLEEADTQTRMFVALKKMITLYLNVLKKAEYNPFDARYSRAVPFLGIRVLI